MGLAIAQIFAHILEVYRRRQYEFAISSDSNKALIWKAAGARDTVRAGLRRHSWPHPPDFNRPDVSDEAASNKIAWNINRFPLPRIGDTAELWDEVCRVNLEAAMDHLVGQQDVREAIEFLRHLPRPIVLLHTAGNTSPESKSLPDEIVYRLYSALLNSMPGSLILLDWDSRMHQLANARMRHTLADWGHINLVELAALMRESALLIGIDSGPYHFASLTRTPALGVFHRHYPSCVALPRASNVNMTRASFGDVNIARRAKWNIVEYQGEMPTAEEVTRHACRMLDGPRYGLPLGRDVMLQQWIRDWSYGSNAYFPVIDRNHTLDFLLRETTRRFTEPKIVETACIGSREDWSSGYSTYLFGAYLDGLQKGSLISLDANLEHCRLAERAVEAWRDRTIIIHTDPIEWLSRNGGHIDVLYHDSATPDASEHAEQSLLQTQQAEKKLSAKAMVVYDDSPWQGGWVGRGAKAIPYLLERGWRVIAAGYQTILSKA